MAEGEAEARIKVADAEAAALKKIKEAISGGNAAHYLIAIRYIEALKGMVTGKDNKVVYMPYEATGVLSSLGGIREMLDGAGTLKK